MKVLSTLLLSIISFGILGQDLQGAWKWQGEDEEGNAIMAVAIFADGFQAATWYDLTNKKFIRTNGGTWKYSENVLTEIVEFDSRDSTRVGNTAIFEINIEDNKITVLESGNIWTRIDDGSPGELAGAWLITGRQRQGKMSEIDPYRPRKTMKILSGTRFQWIAYNTETRQFMGTGGGTYTTTDGEYIENIEFFSRDDSRVGASLEFNYELKEGNWHHSGLSSRGSPIYEIWSIREK